MLISRQIPIGAVLLFWCCSYDTSTTAFQLARPKPTRQTTDTAATTTFQQSNVFSPTARTHATTTTTSLRASSSSSSRSKNNGRRRRQLSKDVVIVGGGLAGLSAALYLSQIDPDRHITILDKEDIDNGSKNAVSSFAAAGMLAPNSERLSKGSYLDLCLESKSMFRDFCDLVESLAQEHAIDGGENGSPFLPKSDADKNNGMEPWNVGYVGAGGFLSPAFAGDTVATWAPPEDSKGAAQWLDSYQVRELEPNLNPNVVGGWWFPEDASVDARRLTCSLRAACAASGVEYLSGANYEVSSLDLSDGQCKGLWLKNGKFISTKSILVANGAWMRTLLPVPLEPHKGQSISLRMPQNRPPLLRRVIFAQDSYIVPKADGRIVIGATVEAGSFDPNVTPAGIMHILQYATEIMPGLQDLPLEETWAGLRPTTPDKAPILGETPWENLFLAGGYWRNGVLLAPKTGELLASLIAGEELNDQDQKFLKEFAWDRFTAPGKGVTLAANARFAASMYPVHSRKSGTGVAASVGTELGSYSTAVTAGAERAKDRESLWGGDDDAFEEAARLGTQDGSAFSMGDDDDDEYSSIRSSASSSDEDDGDDETPAQNETEEATPTDATWPALLESSKGTVAVPYGGSPDAITVPYSEDKTDKNDLKSRYAEIQKNKAKQSVELDESPPEQRPDPGFRIYHVHKETGKETEVPPYTSPGEFLASLDNDTPATEADEEESSSEETFDGYSTIQNAAVNDDDIRETMRKARMSNRVEEKSEEMDILSAAIDASRRDKEASVSEKEASSATEQAPTQDLASVYKKIQERKNATAVEMNESPAEERPDPGFRIFHIDKETGEHREVPPYTTPGEFLERIEKEKDDALDPPRGLDACVDKVMPPTEAENDIEAPPQEEGYSETTYDGYQDIISANGSDSRADELAAMRAARQKNRIGQDTVSDADINLG